MRVVVLCSDEEAADRDPESVASILRDLGCAVEVGRFDGGGLSEERLLKEPPNIVVLDAGDEVQRAQRALRRLGDFEPLADVPVLMCVVVPRLGALDFSAGTADFILKPIVPAELYARLRQLDWKAAAFESEELIKVGDLVMDLAGYEVRLRGRTLELTHQEFELLKFLAQNRGRVYTREQLLKHVWGYQYYGGSRTVDIHVRRLRAKLGAAEGGLIDTVRNVGYKMRSPESDAGRESDARGEK